MQKRSYYSLKLHFLSYLSAHREQLSVFPSLPLTDWGLKPTERQLYQAPPLVIVENDPPSVHLSWCPVLEKHMMAVREESERKEELHY